MQTATLSTLLRSDYQAYLAGLVLMALICHLAVLLTDEFTFVSLHISLFDFASGVSVGALIVYGVRFWPAVLIGIASAYLVNQEELTFVAAISIEITLEAIIAAILVRHYLHQHFSLDYIPDLLKYFFITTLCVVLLGGSLLTAILVMLDGANSNEIGFIWVNACMSKVTGVAIVAPFIMVWSQNERDVDDWPKLLELLFLAVVLLLCGGVVFFGWFDASISGYSHYPLAYLFFPILAWAAFRFDQRVATAATMIITAFALWALLHQLGPFSRNSTYESYFLTWLCINTAAVLSMILAADITYCKKVRVALQKSDERLDLATSGSQDGLWDWTDINSDQMWWSPNFYQLLDYRDDEIYPSHKQLVNLMHPDDRELHYSALEKHINGDEPYNIDFRVQTKSQGYRWFHAKAEVTVDKNTGAQRMAGSIIDIDDRKIAQNEIINLNKTLERRVVERTTELEEINKDLHREILERNKAELEIVKLQNDLIRMGRIMTMGEMASALAHELHQPLMAIVNYSQSALMDLNEDEAKESDLIKSIEIISEQAIRGGEIIRNMKSFAIRGETQLERFDINQIVIELRPLFDIEVAQNNISLHIELEKKEMIANINQIQMQQVISNLVKNSIEAMKYNVTEKKLYIRTSICEGDYALIEVIDNGAGVDEKNINNIFESFYTTKSEGLGLGLSISQKIIEKHNGKLSIFNSEHRTTAQIKLKLFN